MLNGNKNIFLLIIFFINHIFSFSLVDFIKTKNLKDHCNKIYFNRFKKFSPTRKILNGSLLASLIIAHSKPLQEKIPITQRQQRILFFTFVPLLIMQIKKSIHASTLQNAHADIHKIWTKATQQKTGNLMFVSNQQKLSSKIWFILDSEKVFRSSFAPLHLPKLIKLKKLSDLLENQIKSQSFFLTPMKKNTLLKKFLLKHKTLIQEIFVDELIPLKKISNLKNSLKITLSVLLLILNIITKKQMHREIKILTLLILLPKNRYFEFFIVPIIICLSKKQRINTGELEKLFLAIDKTHWDKNLTKIENYTSEDYSKNEDTISRAANVFFLSKIKEALKENKKEIKKEDSKHFYNFLNALIYSHALCHKNCQARTCKDLRNVPCRMIDNYGFLGSLADTIDWFTIEKNKTIYEFQDTKDKETIYYQDLSGEIDIKKLIINNDILNLSNEIKSLKKKKK